jgi:folate-binding protein YgfZ
MRLEPGDAARSGAALADLPRAVLAVTGPLRVKFLQGLVSNDVAGRSAGEGCLAALLDAKGHVQSFLRALVSTDTVFLEVPQERLDTVERLLVHYRVAAPVRFARPAARVLALLGPEAAAVLGRCGASVPDQDAEAHASTSLSGVPALVARASDVPAHGLVLHVPSEAMQTVRGALTGAGAVAITASTMDVLRVEDGIPWYGPDVTDANLLHETGLVRLYHSPAKGCYVGQENVARLEARGGNVNKALRGLRLGAPATAGDAIAGEGGDVGRITTAGLSPRLGPIAMGYVHRSRFEPGSVVEVAGAAATVAALPLVGRREGVSSGP